MSNNNFNIPTAQEHPDFNRLFEESVRPEEMYEGGDELETPVLVIDLDEVNQDAQNMASLITERLSNYYFDEEYINHHPYIPTKIATEMNNIRRLLKMLCVNEKAQDALISNITLNAGKGSLYAALTSLQNSMLSIQRQLNDLTSELESIFQRMQEEAEKTYAEQQKEDGGNGTMVVRGSREFIEKLTAMSSTKAKSIIQQKRKTDEEIDAEELAKVL